MHPGIIITCLLASASSWQVLAAAHLGTFPRIPRPTTSGTCNNTGPPEQWWRSCRAESNHSSLLLPRDPRNRHTSSGTGPATLEAPDSHRCRSAVLPRSPMHSSRCPRHCTWSLHGPRTDNLPLHTPRDNQPLPQGPRSWKTIVMRLVVGHESGRVHAHMRERS